VNLASDPNFQHLSDSLLSKIVASADLQPWLCISFPILPPHNVGIINGEASEEVWGEQQQEFGRQHPCTPRLCKIALLGLGELAAKLSGVYIRDMGCLTKVLAWAKCGHLLMGNK
jgi:hypothetical protein